MEKNYVKSIHIENDIVNSQPTLVYVDMQGEEWVHEEQPVNNGSYVSVLKKKKDSWFFDPKNKK